jgi:DNA topoisomerase-1
VAPRKKTTTEDAPVTRKKAAAAKPKAAPAPVRKRKAAGNGEGPAAAGGGGKNLVIVESPAKAKTIQKYLGPNFEVAASYGHVRDLPKKVKRGEIGIDIAAGWVPTYVNLDDDRHKKVIAELKKKAAKAPVVFLAPDRDREGEAIAWHLKEALKLRDERIRRVTFNEITKKAIQDAFNQAHDINMDLVRAQEARRFLDRAVGYKLSPLLRKKIRAESAGRVQSVAVRLVVERELEIQAFKPEEYWKVTALLAPRGTVKIDAPLVQAKVKKKAEGDKGEDEQAALEAREGTFLAELAEWNGQKFAGKTEQDATAVLARLVGAAYGVAKVEQKDRAEKAQPPFTTSSLQQQANIRLGYRTHQTMSIAQQLYEGVALGSEGSVALITYMRTDSTHIAAEALQACRDHVNNNYGPAYLPAKPNFYAAGKGAQEAHEAIRPTDLAYTPQRVKPYLNDHQFKLYELIFNRFVACQMTPAVWAVTNVDVHAAPAAPAAAEGQPAAAPLPPAVFKAQGKILKFDGYRRVLPPKGKQEDATLPPLTEKQLLDLLDLLGSQHFTQPPPRYNEASLVKALEKEGIGRPSTYASIIKKIQDREYVEQRERRFHATPLGMLATEKLIAHFPEVMDLKFTSHVEEDLDKIEGQQMALQDVLNEFWVPFSKALDKAQTEWVGSGVETGEKCPVCGRPLVVKYSRKRKGKQFIGCSGYGDKEKPCDYIKPGEGEEARAAPVLTDIPCPKCGKMMLQREGQRGTFLGCSGYPECQTKMNFDDQGKPVLTAVSTEHTCEKCGKPMIQRQGRTGPFLGCSGYPKCKNTVNLDASGNPVKPIETGINCEKCGKPMSVRRGGRGPFLGCSGYPKCRSTKPMPEDLKEKVKELMPAPAKQAVPQVEVKELCPDCGGPMQVKRSARGFFLGCTKFPKCRGTRKASPDLLELLQEAATS